MHLGAITDIGHARGLAPRNTARVARLASGSPGEGGAASHAGSPWACRFVILTASATALGWSIRKAGLNAHRLGSRLEEWGRR